MKYAKDTHNGVFQIPLSEQNAILESGMIKNAPVIKKRIADKNKLGEQFGITPSVFINPKKVVDEKYGLGLTAEKNREAVYKWRKTPAGQDKYNEYQMKLYRELSQNDEWRKKYNERAKEANRRYREKKAIEEGRADKKKQREEARQARIANKKPVGRPAKYPKQIKAVGYNPQTQMNTKVQYKNRSTYNLKNPRKQIGKGMYDEGIEFCDKPYYDSDIFV